MQHKRLPIYLLRSALLFSVYFVMFVIYSILRANNVCKNQTHCVFLNEVMESLKQGLLYNKWNVGKIKPKLYNLRVRLLFGLF